MGMSAGMSDFLNKITEERIQTPETGAAYEQTKQIPAVKSEAQSDSQLLRQIRQAGVSCFGGRLFRGTDAFGDPIVRFAVPGMDAEDVKNAEEHYSMMGRMSALGMAHRTNTPPQTVQHYTVFDFEIGSEEYTLRELHDSGRPFRRNPETVFRAMVQLLRRYRAELAKMGRDYRSLNCLTRETVILDADNNLKLIPLYTTGSDYPIEIPREVTAGGGDERSDLYAAAYVAVEVHSAGRSDGRLVEPDCAPIVRCLKTIRDCRPDLDEVQLMLFGPDAVVRTEPRIKPVYDYDGNNTRSGERVKESASQMGGFLSGVWEKLKEWTAPIEDLEEEETPQQTDATMHPSRANRPGDPQALGDSPNGTFHQRGV